MTGSSRDTWLILIISLVVSIIFISFFLKLLKGIFMLLLLAIVLPVVYVIVRWAFRSRKKPEKLEERGTISQINKPN